MRKFVIICLCALSLILSGCAHSIQQSDTAAESNPQEEYGADAAVFEYLDELWDQGFPALFDCPELDGIYTDPENIFQIDCMRGWEYARSTEVDPGNGSFRVETVLFAKGAYKPEDGGYLGYGLRLNIYLPPNNQVWVVNPSEWSKSYMDDVLRGNPGYEIIDQAMEDSQSIYILQGQFGPSYEPETCSFYLVAEADYLVALEFVLPDSRYEPSHFKECSYLLLESLVLWPQE